MNCYKFQKITFKTGLFDIIDMTYVIHLENNGRLDNVIKELNTFKPSKNIIILHIKGKPYGYIAHYINSQIMPHILWFLIYI